MLSQLLIRILSSEVPLDGSIFLVAGLLPRINFGLQKFSIGNASIQTLAAENSDLYLSHVQPSSRASVCSETARDARAWRPRARQA